MALLTNASAQTALKTLRAMQASGDDVRLRVSTGLKVRSADDNPAFFLVSNTTRGDISVTKGLRDNLAMLEGSIGAAQAGLRELNRLTLQIADMIPVAQNGVAIEELEAASSFVGRWMDILRPGHARIEMQGDDLTPLEQEAVVVSLENLETFPFVADAVDSGDVTVASGSVRTRGATASAPSASTTPSTTNTRKMCVFIRSSRREEYK